MGGSNRRSVSNTEPLVAGKQTKKQLAHDGASHRLTWHRPATQGGRPATPGSTTTIDLSCHIFTALVRISYRTRLQRPSQGQCRGWGTASHSTPYTPSRLACVPPSPIAPWHGVWPLTDPLVRFGTKVKLHQPMSKTVAPPQRTAGQFPVPPSHAKLRVPIFHFTTARHAHCPSSSLHSSLTLFCSTSQPKCTLLDPSPWLVDSAAKPVVHLWEHYNLFFPSAFHRQLDLIHSLLPGSGQLKIKISIIRPAGFFTLQHREDTRRERQNYRVTSYRSAPLVHIPHEFVAPLLSTHRARSSNSYTLARFRGFLITTQVVSDLQRQ